MLYNILYLGTGFASWLAGWFGMGWVGYIAAGGGKGGKGVYMPSQLLLAGELVPNRQSGGTVRNGGRFLSLFWDG